jgi:hypothetical protein
VEEGRPKAASYQTAYATPAQVGFIEKLLRRKDRTAEEICLRFSVPELSRLTVPQASLIIDRLKQLPDAGQEERGDDGYRVQA